MKKEQSVPKRRHIKFRSRGITQEKEYIKNINSQLDAKITNVIDNYNQLSMFRAIVSPILRNTRLCSHLVV